MPKRTIGIVIIRCPKTGNCISTGMEVNRAAFGSMPVFFGSTFCPACRVSHEWFAPNAWVCDYGPKNCDPNCERRKQRVRAMSSISASRVVMSFNGFRGEAQIPSFKPSLIARIALAIPAESPVTG